MFIGESRRAGDVADIAVYAESDARRTDKDRLQENGNGTSLGRKA